VVHDRQEVVPVRAPYFIEVFIARAGLAGEVAAALPREIGLATVGGVAVDQPVVVPFTVALPTEVQTLQPVLDAVLRRQFISGPNDEAGVMARLVQIGGSSPVGQHGVTETRRRIGCTVAVIIARRVFGGEPVIFAEGDAL